MSATEDDQKRSRLFVEGESDYHFVGHLCHKHKMKARWLTEAKTGYSNVIAAAKAAFTERDGPPVGIVVDADRDFANRWSDIVSEFSRPDPQLRVPVPIPQSPDPRGTVVEQSGGLPRVGIWVMPDNGSPGDLETFAVQMIPDRDEVWPLAQDYIDGIPDDRAKRFGCRSDRATLYAWIATGKKPPYLGLAVKNEELNWQTPNCKAFVAWLGKLFGPRP